MNSESRSSRWFRYYLIATTVLCGALVMVVEVLGSRVLGPFFGVSLFVWTSLITVTLVALAAGYAIGGRWSDRRDSPDALYLILMVAGALVLLVPYLIVQYRRRGRVGARRTIVESLFLLYLLK